jgi:hypothetical protein
MHSGAGTPRASEIVSMGRVYEADRRADRGQTHAKRRAAAGPLTG